MMHRYAFLFILLCLPWGGKLHAQDGSAATGPHVALLLPLQSASFGRAAEAFRHGITTAALFQPGLPLVSYPTGGNTEEILQAYHRALESDAVLVVGPLTRNAVSALLEEPLLIPTLALNTPEQHDLLPENLYVLSLSVESEARQSARLAYSEGRRAAFAASAGAPLDKRVLAAFSDEWVKLGGAVVQRANFTANPATYPKLRATIAGSGADMLFLAADAQKARAVRPYLDRILPVYATSQVYGDGIQTGGNHDLNQVRFVEMPWFLRPDHPAVLAYPRPATPLSVEQERFYALGLDAWRVVQQLLAPTPEPWPLEGVTGRIGVDGQYFTRELSAAQFHNGNVVPLVAP